MALDRYDDARGMLDQAASHGVEFSGGHRIAYLLAFIAGDERAMSAHFNASIGVGRTNAAYGWQAHAAAFAGRVPIAHEQFRRGVQLAREGGFKEVAAQLSIEDAEAHAIAGQCAETMKEIPDGLELSRDNFSLERASRAYALCGAERETAALVGELRQRYPEATITTRLLLPATAAAAATKRGEWRRALEILEPVKPYDHSPWAEFWPAYLRGLSHLELKHAGEAAREFQRIVDHRGEAPLSQLYPLASLGLARAAVLNHDVDRARAAYDQFLRTWPNADPTQEPLRSARRERGQLR
jgi:hypothetical protein